MTEEIMIDFSKYSQDVKSWSINSPNQNSQIEIYLFDSANVNSGYPATFKNNCRYLGDSRRIVCDVSLIRNVINRFELNTKLKTEFDHEGYVVKKTIIAEDELELVKTRKIMLTWVLSHELGHLVNKHVGSFYFEQHSFDQAMSPLSYCHKMELEADNFLLSVYPNQGEYEKLFFFLYHLMNLELIRMSCPNGSLHLPCEHIKPGTGRTISTKRLEYDTGKSHPDYIIRLLRIIDAISERQDFRELTFQARQLILDGILKPIAPENYAKDCPVKIVKGQ
jgi:hypothetical protein